MKSFFRKISTSMVRLFSGGKTDRLLYMAMEEREKAGNGFITYNERPKKPLKHSPSSHPSTLILLQGPILHENNFTLETIRFYKSLFPVSTIVISTWKNENTSEIEKEGITVIQSDKPNFAGPQNINMQVASTMAGLNFAKKQTGITHVLKMRTDQRLYKPGFLSYFHFLLQNFPAANGPLKSRLIIPDFGTLKYRLYGPSDMFMFGHLDDMLLYWNCTYDMRELPKERKEKSMLDIAKLKLSEVYLCTSFLERISHPIDWTLEDTWKIYADYFCIADGSSFDLYWPKYDRHRENKYQYYTNHTLQQSQFSEWLMAYKGKLPEFPANVLNTDFGSEIK